MASERRERNQRTTRPWLPQPQSSVVTHPLGIIVTHTIWNLESAGAIGSTAAAKSQPGDPANRESGPGPRRRHGPGSALLWCGRKDSNLHGVTHWNLNPARLPVPPRPHMQLESRAERLVAQIMLADRRQGGRRKRGGGCIRSRLPAARSPASAGTSVFSDSTKNRHSLQTRFHVPMRPDDAGRVTPRPKIRHPKIRHRQNRPYWNRHRWSRRSPHPHRHRREARRAYR